MEKFPFLKQKSSKLLKSSSNTDQDMEIRVPPVALRKKYADH